ncbi:TetR/AcrR family transcriptional regulator [Spirillospora sp. NPDC047279]|uniref:TetR/AcrR family transcriptional regulator n=1 Tax=Spirillospora sp. NPDC047279 TaxID=3155478 RepID=UPI0033C67A22
MDEGVHASGGVTRRRRRLSDEETEQRMLRAAMDMVGRSGLTVGLDHISFEDVIRDAGVARSAVYRRWPYKDLFFSELLKELARGRSPVVGAPNDEAEAAVRRTVAEHLDWLRTPALRRALVGEVLRRAAVRELETFHNAPEWRTYIALHATFLSLPGGELRTEVQAALTESERDLTRRIAGSYEYFTRLLGCRLRPDLVDATFEVPATLANATMRGLVIMAPSNPGITGRTVRANPYGAPEAADWSQAALGIASVVLTFIEPDPDVEFDDERIAAVRRELSGA